MGRRLDALLTLAVLAPAAAAVVALDAPVTVPAVAAGAAGALVIEALLSLRAARVRAVWERTGVRAASVVAGLLLGGAAVALFGPVAATALVAGLCAYLLFLAAATLRDRIASVVRSDR